jgi:uncharacterized membrane protein YhhN
MFNCGPILLAGTFLAALAEWWAVWKGRKRLEYFAKPTVMIALFAWLVKTAGLQGALLWFGIGILFSLAGDVFMLLNDHLSELFFSLGLAAFLLAHLAYIVGFSFNLVEVPVFWAGMLALILALSAGRLLRRITSGMRAKGLKGLVAPVWVYGIVISIMLFSAMLTLSRLDWKALPAMLVSVGAFLFYISDIILAWNRFVAPIRNGRVINIAIYHLGQIALIIGVALQF